MGLPPPGTPVGAPELQALLRGAAPRTSWPPPPPPPPADGGPETAPSRATPASAMLHLAGSLRNDRRADAPEVRSARLDLAAFALAAHRRMRDDPSLNAANAMLAAVPADRRDAVKATIAPLLVEYAKLASARAPDEWHAARRSAGLAETMRHHAAAGLSLAHANGWPASPRFTARLPSCPAAEELLRTGVHPHAPVVFPHNPDSSSAPIFRGAWGDPLALADRPGVGNATLRRRCSQQDRATKFGDARRLAEGSVDVYDWTSATFGSFLANDKDQRLYAARLELKRDLPALLADVPEHGSLWFSPCFGAPSAKGPISYFGSGAQQTPWHFDNQEGMVFVAAGSKTFELAPPSASAFLGPGPYPQNTLYATGAHAARVAEEVTVRAGEWLYLPACWWHRVTGGNGYNATLNLWFAMPEEKVDAKRRQAYERFQVGLLRAELLEVLGEESDQHTPALDDAQRAALTEREGVLAKRRQHFGSAPVDGMLERVRASAEHVVEGLY